MIVWYNLLVGVYKACTLGSRKLEKGVTMLVSAISVNRNNGYNISSNMPFYNNRSNETIGDTSFNSLTPYSNNNKKLVSADKLPQVYDNINEWKNFCHKQILGKKLNTIA